MEKKTVFLTIVLGKLNIHMQRMKVGAYFTPLTKINLKWIKDLIQRVETIKLLENNRQ